MGEVYSTCCSDNTNLSLETEINKESKNSTQGEQTEVISKVRNIETNTSGLVHREQFNCKQLMTKFPPQFKDKRKKSIFKSIVPNGAKDCPGYMVYSRYQLIELPTVIPDPTDFIQHRLKIEPNIFEYVSNTEDPSTAHFYVNFADANLFGFYSGSLFAQDEIMVLEHPILASLREKLLDINQAYCRGSVVILNALKHGHFSQTNLDKIYGRKFATSSVDKIKKSVDKCQPVIIDNIVCIASLVGRESKYTKQEIDKILKTAYCGFNGAVSEIVTHDQYERRKVIIQTGVRKLITRNRWNGYVIHRWFDLKDDVVLFKIKKISESDTFFVQFPDSVYEDFDKL